MTCINELLNYFVGVFILLNAYAFLKYLQSYMTRSELKTIFVFSVAAIGVLVFLGVVVLTYAGNIQIFNGVYFKLEFMFYLHITSLQYILNMFNLKKLED